MPSFKTATLGCKVNQYETQLVREALSRLGYSQAKPGQPADLCVVNTCTVTAEADLKSRKLIRHLARANPQARIVVMGCYATRAPQAIMALPGVAEVITDKQRVPDWLARLGLRDMPAGISQFGQRHRAYVKIQDGCRMGCTYCIIPRVRPVLRSRPSHLVLAEVRHLVAQGFKEIVLTGVHLGHYGVDPQAPEGTNLVSLLAQLVALEGDFRLRLSSLEPSEVTGCLLRLMAQYPERICPHLHIAMQSGSETVLRRMGRPGIAALRQACQSACHLLDQPALTTDALVGFPGETERDFDATCRVVEQIGFSKVHVFRFSPRQGTLAADMPDQVPAPVQRRRARALARLAEHLRQKYFQSLCGQTLEVLVETADPSRPNTVVGTAERYVPVAMPGDQELLGRLVRVDVRDASADRLLGLALTQALPPTSRQ